MLQFQRRLGSAAVTTSTVLGQMQFTGWDGAVDGLGAQIRSVLTVSEMQAFMPQRILLWA